MKQPSRAAHYKETGSKVSSFFGQIIILKGGMLNAVPFSGLPATLVVWFFDYKWQRCHDEPSKGGGCRTRHL